MYQNAKVKVYISLMICLLYLLNQVENTGNSCFYRVMKEKRQLVKILYMVILVSNKILPNVSHPALCVRLWEESSAAEKNCTLRAVP